MITWVIRRLNRWLRLLRRLLQWIRMRPSLQRRARPVTLPSRRVFVQPKPKWVKHEVIRLKAMMPQAGCRMITLTSTDGGPREGS